jgi:hypothetical protein
MRNMARSMVDGLLTVVLGIFTIGMHSSLLTIFGSHIQRRSAFHNYRPVYTRSGRRKHSRSQ